MQLRMLARRSLSGSMTVVGDIAQATGAWAPSSWAQVVEHLPARRGWRLVELTVNYRTPAEIMEVAGRVLEQVAPGMRPPESVRASGHPRGSSRQAGPSSRRRVCPGAAEGLVDLTVSSVREEISARWRAPGAPSAVIVPPRLLDRRRSGLAGPGHAFGYAGRGALDEPVSAADRRRRQGARSSIR